MNPALLRYTLAPFATRRINQLTGTDRLPKNGPAVLAINHVSLLEPALVGAVLLRTTGRMPVFPTSAHIVKAFGWFGPHLLGMLPLNPAEPKEVLTPALEHLSQGGLVGMFPEARRNESPDLLTGHTGVARLVLRSGVPVIPIGYIGPPVATREEWIRVLFSSHDQIEFHVGNPMEFATESESTKERLYQVTDDIMRAIAPLCKKKFIPR